MFAKCATCTLEMLNYMVHAGVGRCCAAHARGAGGFFRKPGYSSNGFQKPWIEGVSVNDGARSLVILAPVVPRSSCDHGEGKMAEKKS